MTISKKLFCSFVIVVTISQASSDIIKVGSGSYTKSRPEACQKLPDEIFKVAGLKGATPTNQWWSSLVWDQFSNNLFPHPLSMVCHAGGMAIAYPGSGLVGGGGNIMGGGLSKQGDLVIGHSAFSEFSASKLADFSSWFVTADFSSEENNLRLSFGHGSPFVYGKIKGGDPQLTFADQPQVWFGEEGDHFLGVTVRGNHYGLFGAKGSKWSGLRSKVFTNESSKGYFSVALLPDREESTWQAFAKVAHHHVMQTKVSPSRVKGYLRTRYQFETQAMEGEGKGTLYALYPHQWKYSKAELLGKSYRSVRGEMKLASGLGFETVVPIQGVLPMLPAEGIADRELMLGYLKKEADQIGKVEFKDTYWEGKYLGSLASLSGIAEVMGEKELQNVFLGEIRRRLEDWLTASEGEDSPLFYYNEKWGAMIGNKPSYGSAEQLNDHHFHYGYFIRAAAEVARLDPDWAQKWGPMVNLVIRDIASTQPKDEMFPSLRCFDRYAGHSWASGHARFGDGNNQESSSESMNAWYGMMLWGEVTGNEVARETGIFLYNTERTAVEEYWFDVNSTNFPKDFPHVALGMVWGGKGAFATWFSGDIDCIHGINWLPFTPASIYMGRFPDYVKKNHQRILEQREHGADFNKGWGDLIVMFGALSDPRTAATYLNENPNGKLEGGNTQAFMAHWIHTLDRLGRNDASVTADHPYVNVYLKNEKKTYAAYNFGSTKKDVVFSDGFRLQAGPKKLTVKSAP